MTDSPMAANMARAIGGREEAILAAAALRRDAVAARASTATLRTQAASALRASAQKIDPTDQKANKAAERRRQKSAWQSDGWDYYDNVPEVGFGGRFFGNNLAKLILYAGYIAEPGQPPVPVTATDDDGNDLLSLAVQQACTAALDRIESQQGGHAEHLRDYGINSWVAGECTLVGLPDKDSPSGEAWAIYSSSELVQKGGKWLIKTDPDQQDSDAIVVPDDTPMYRLWIQHPRWSSLPDSPVHRILELCDELMLLTRSVRAGAMSRIPRGILVVPESALKGPVDVTTDAEANGEERGDPTINALVAHFSTPIGDPGSASAVTPYVLAVPDAVADKVQYLDVGSVFSTEEAAARTEIIRRMANGVDLPPEILLGLADSNHWTSWYIDEQTWKAYLEPYAQNYVLSLTAAYYQEALRKAGVTDLERHVIWYDPAAIIGHGDQAASATVGADAGRLSDDAWRRYNGFSDTDAPTEDDERRSIVLDIIRGTPSLAPLLLPTIGIELPLAEGTAEALAGVDEVAVVDTTAVETTPAVGPPPLPEPIAAAAFARKRTTDLAALGMRLARIDQALRVKLTAAADASMRRAVERAGARLRSQSLKASAAHRDAIDGVPNDQIAARLGPALVAALGQDTDSLLRDSFDDLHDRFDTWTAQAQRQSVREMERAGVVLDPGDIAALERSQDSDRDAAWTLLVALLIRQATTVLYRADAVVEQGGEFDASTTVPAAIIREAMSRAGGAVGTTTPGGSVVVGPLEQLAGAVATGTRTTDVLATVNITPGGFVWLYGDPGSRTTNFEPHENLDQEPFANFSDPVLFNPDEWPDVEFFRPGDHLYCQCDFAPAFTEGGSPADDAEGSTLVDQEV